MKGLNLMDKTLAIKGAKIAFTIWDVGGMFHFIILFLFLVIFF